MVLIPSFPCLIDINNDILDGIPWKLLTRLSWYFCIHGNNCNFLWKEDYHTKEGNKLGDLVSMNSSKVSKHFKVAVKITGTKFCVLFSFLFTRKCILYC